MAYIELLIRINRDDAEALSDALIEAGALSAAIEDADAGTADEDPLFGEPGGEPDLPAWTHSIIVALFDDNADLDAAYAAACAAADVRGLPAPVRRPVAEQDWVRLTQSQFDPIHVGERLWIVPSWHDTPTAAIDRSDAVLLHLDPGLAFGTGSHPTTRLCLAWLEDHLQPGANVIDYGCGSGILAIAAKLLGAGTVVGTDIDEHAISASIANAAANRVSAHFVGPDAFHSEPVDVVVANILSNPLKVLAPLLCDLVAPGGRLVLSGILERQWQEVAAVYAPMIELDLWRVEEGWVCLAGTRPLAAEPDWATRCPECATVFSFSLEEIRGHGGRVRCGVCGAVFNALDHARDPDQFRESEPPSTAPESAAPLAHGAGADAATADLLPAAAGNTATSAALTDASFLRTSGSARISPGRRRLYGIASAILAVLLCVQAVNIWRNELAAYIPALKPSLVEACHQLGCVIEPLAQIDHLFIESAELQALPGQASGYAYVALLRNRGAIALRFPHIELTLTDAQGHTVVRRALAPIQYLSESQRPGLNAGLGANAELPVRVAFELPGDRATGFRSILFYPFP